MSHKLPSIRIEFKYVDSISENALRAFASCAEDVVFVFLRVVAHVDHHMGNSMTGFPGTTPEDQVTGGKFLEQLGSRIPSINVIEGSFPFEPVILLVRGPRNIFNSDT